MDVFGILERDGKVYTVAVPNCKKETLMAKIEAATVEGSVFYTDEFVSYNALSRYGKHVPIDDRHEFADGETHINTERKGVRPPNTVPCPTRCRSRAGWGPN